MKYSKLPGIHDLHDFIIVRSPDTGSATMLVCNNYYGGPASKSTMKLNPDVSSESSAIPCEDENYITLNKKRDLTATKLAVYTDHAAVQAVLETPSPNGKYSRWWSKLFGSGLRSIKILYIQDNKHAYASSHNPSAQLTIDESHSACDATVTAVQSQNMDLINQLLQAEPVTVIQPEKTSVT